MIIYKISTSIMPEAKPTSVINLDNKNCIPFDPANTDYQTFKAQINDETAQLEDADGNLMTADEAKAFVKELP